MQRCERGGRHGRRLLKREVGRLQRELVFGAAGILGTGAVACAEHLITRLELLRFAAYRLDSPCHVVSRNTSFWLEQACEQAHEQWSASHGEAVACVEPRRVNAHQHLIVADDRLVNVPEPQQFG